MKKYLLAGILTLAIFIGVLVGKLSHPTQVEGSIDYQGGGYYATSTRAFDGTAIASLKVLKAGSGIFGSLVITGAGAGVVNFFDATTSDANKRTGNTATSTLLIASFPASTAAGTYTFDASFNVGLLMETGGTVPTSTPTWK